jgi:hypothetical protein
MKKSLFILAIVLLFSSCSKDYKFEPGDVVCFKLTGKKVIILKTAWLDGDYYIKFPMQPNYKNSRDQQDRVYEIELEKCKVRSRWPLINCRHKL